jgi:hypothetical protein
VPEIEQVFAGGILRLSGPDELGEVDGLEAEAKHIDGVGLADAETQFQVILCRILFPDVVDDHPHIVEVPLRMFAVPPDGVLHGAGDLPVLFLQDVEVVL